MSFPCLGRRTGHRTELCLSLEPLARDRRLDLCMITSIFATHLHVLKLTCSSGNLGEWEVVTQPGITGGERRVRLRILRVCGEGPEEE